MKNSVTKASLIIFPIIIIFGIIWAINSANTPSPTTALDQDPPTDEQTAEQSTSDNTVSEVNENTNSDEEKPHTYRNITPTTYTYRRAKKVSPPVVQQVEESTPTPTPSAIDHSEDLIAVPMTEERHYVMIGSKPLSELTPQESCLLKLGSENTCYMWEQPADNHSEEALYLTGEEIERRRGEEIAKMISRNNSTGNVVASGLNSYPKAGDCPQMNYTNIGYVIYYDGMAICQCTSYANWKVRESWGRSAVNFGIMGNAKDWGRSAAAAGLRVDDQPEAHTVGYQTSGIFGHVVWIEGVNADGTVNLSEYNNLYSSVSGQKGDFGYRTNVPASSFRYIHFN